MLLLDHTKVHRSVKEKRKKVGYLKLSQSNVIIIMIDNRAKKVDLAALLLPVCIIINKSTVLLAICCGTHFHIFWGIRSINSCRFWILFVTFSCQGTHFVTKQKQFPFFLMFHSGFITNRFKVDTSPCPFFLPSEASNYVYCSVFYWYK